MEQLPSALGVEEQAPQVLTMCSRAWTTDTLDAGKAMLDEQQVKQEPSDAEDISNLELQLAEF